MKEHIASTDNLSRQRAGRFVRKGRHLGNGDYGYFGSGTEGYIHYMQSFEETNKGGGGGGRKPSQNGGCLTLIVTVLGAVLLLIMAF